MTDKITLMLIGITIMASADTAFARRSYAPDITSDAYWDTHHICLARVTSVAEHKDKSDPYARFKDRVTFEVVRRFSEGPGDPTRTVTFSSFWFGRVIDALDAPVIEEGDSLVVFYRKDEQGQIAVEMLETEHENSALIKTLSRIAELRVNKGGLDALSEGVFSPDPKLAVYCIKRMMTQSVRDAAAYVARLRKLRDNEAADARVRLLASQLAGTLDAGALDANEDYAWVKATLASAKLEDPQQVRLFVRRLLEFEGKRDENVRSLVRLVRDPDTSEVIRLVALSEFSDARLLKFDRPDDLSNQLFEACTALLKERSPAVRNSAAHMLRHICNRIAGNAAPEIGDRYLQRAAAEIGAAMAKETDELTKSRMERHLQFIEAGATPTKLIESGIIPDPGLNR